MPSCRPARRSPPTAHRCSPARSSPRPARLWPEFRSRPIATTAPITVAVYTDAKGEYSFPSWSDLTPGSYSVGVELPDFEHAAQPVAVSEGKAAQVDFTLKAKPLAYEDATASEIIAGLPGTDQQKVLFSQCSNCHTLQWALQAGRTKEGWVEIIKKMAGRAADRDDAGHL